MTVSRLLAYGAGSLYAVAVLFVGIPVMLVQLLFYYLRRRIFGVPMNGDWGELGQCEVHRKGPNTWN